MKAILVTILVMMPASLLMPVGCGVIETDYGTCPGDARLAAIVPGATRRDEVFALLGPPEEFRFPNPLDGSRSFSPQALRIRDERRVFDLSTVSYVHEHHVRRFLFLVLFRLTLVKARADRVFITFDENDVVRELGVSRDADET
ncbi:MAG: hypothetical protein U1E76_02700 [Planctomycetota bacterium]